MISFISISNDVRIPENNDWVIILLLCCAFLYVFMMISLHRDASVKSFLQQEFAESSNLFISWVIVSLVTCLTLAALISQHIPIVPKAVSELQILGLQLNKFGFTFLTLVLFYLCKAALSYLFFQSVGFSRRWPAFTFTATRFYFVLSLFLMAACTGHYYFITHKAEMLHIYVISFALVVIFKQFYYLFHKNQILPPEWYYKFLYICTLQIMPLLALWKLLFF
ncbi:DUF4271 domain-containing protein [Chryseobacterium sp. MFBS3-17]|uniref:DUF4271 domain-containing protein n=1 Tax=Chryseobacterium sp. MFBS3-17 TaxID=2886689 RepID=UPI001D0DEBDD|nr:DUF4271 domain-containing protein [Chryseobacterium sp. MFBS3-17]MCC2590551.1 DUF4271 domain-containing protein [Chryseobacterium sp. MFBS3-17]